MPIVETVTVRQAKIRLLRLVSMVSRGKEFVITKSGKPIARLIPYSMKNKSRKLGQLSGKIHTKENFDQSLPIIMLDGIRRKDPTAERF